MRVRPSAAQIAASLFLAWVRIFDDGALRGRPCPAQAAEEGHPLNTLAHRLVPQRSECRSRARHRRDRRHPDVDLGDSVSDVAENRPMATVRVIHRPDFGPQAVRIEILCSSGVTSITGSSRQGLSPQVRVPSLIAAGCFEHEARCGTCDLTDAYQQAEVDLRVAPAEAWKTWHEIQRQRRSRGYWM